MTTPSDAGTVSARQGQVLIVPTTLYHADGVTPVDLTPVGTTVRFQMYPQAGGVAVVDGSTAIIGAPGGMVQYTGTTADTAMPGAFIGYFVVTIPGSSPVVYPGDGITVTIYPAVGALTGPHSGPCFPWTTADMVRSVVSGIDPGTDLTDWIEAGSEIMWALTGRQFDGLCSATVRPSHQSCSCGGDCAAHAWGWPNIGAFWGYGGVWLGSGGLRGMQTLACQPEIHLGATTRSVTSVKIDGTEVDATTWRLDPGGRLIRVQPDPQGPALSWPCCESPSAPSGAPGTFEVTYLFGEDPPQIVVLGAAVLSGELALGANPATAGTCKLPKHVQSLVRQGVVGTFITDVSTILDRGYTGIPTVDQAIAATNPHHLFAPSYIVSPDLPPHRRMA